MGKTSRRLSIAACVFALLLAGAAGEFTSTSAQDWRPGRSSVPVPDRVDAGTWHGTWWYINRDWQVALWIREESGVPEFKFRFLSVRTAEGFETDWNAYSEYMTHGKGNGRFAVTVSERDANFARGTWDWSLEVGPQLRAERGKFSLFRTGRGRQAVFQFEDFEMLIRKRGDEAWLPVDQSWTFRKISKRLVLWDELPF